MDTAREAIDQFGGIGMRIEVSILILMDTAREGGVLIRFAVILCMFQSSF